MPHDADPTREARRALVERIRADQAFAEQLIADPARALAGADLTTLFGVPGDEDEVVQGYLLPQGATCVRASYCY